MKRSLLVLIALLVALPSMSQVKFGLKGGLNANLYGLEFKEVFEQFNLSKGNNSAGFHAGVTLRVATNLGLYVQGDALYNYASTNINIEDNGVESGSIMIKNHTLDIPALVGFKIAFFRVYAGPTFAINLGKEVGKSVSNVSDIDFKIDNNVFGYQFGVGFDIIKKVTIDLSYNGKFSKSTQQFFVDGVMHDGKFASRQFWLSVGFLF